MQFQFWMQCMENLFTLTDHWPWSSCNLVSVAFVCAFACSSFLYHSTLLYTTPSPAHTPAPRLHWMLRWPSGCRNWHTCILSFQCLSLSYFLNNSFIRRTIKRMPFLDNMFGLWNLSMFVFSFQISLLLTQVSRRLCVCLCQPLPRPPSIHSAHSPSGAWENQWWIWTSKHHQLEDNQGLWGQKGEDKKGETFFFSQPSKKTV